MLRLSEVCRTAVLPGAVDGAVVVDIWKLALWGCHHTARAALPSATYQGAVVVVVLFFLLVGAVGGCWLLAVVVVESQDCHDTAAVVGPGPHLDGCWSPVEKAAQTPRLWAVLQQPVVVKAPKKTTVPAVAAASAH